VCRAAWWGSLGNPLPTIGKYELKLNLKYSKHKISRDSLRGESVREKYGLLLILQGPRHENFSI
jgi:hypothetical protein